MDGHSHRSTLSPRQMQTLCIRLSTSKISTLGQILITREGTKHSSSSLLVISTKLYPRFTVPVLWDKKHHTIVNNESSEIIRMFNTAFNDLISEDEAKLNYYPEELRSEIDALNEWVYDGINSTPSLSASTFAFTKFNQRWRLQIRVRSDPVCL